MAKIIYTQEDNEITKQLQALWGDDKEQIMNCLHCIKEDFCPNCDGFDTCMACNDAVIERYADQEIMKLLQTYEVRQDIFDKILYDYSANVEITDHLDKYVYGYSNKKTIYYDGSEYLICREYILNYYTNSIEGCTE